MSKRKVPVRLNTRQYAMLVSTIEGTNLREDKIAKMHGVSTSTVRRARKAMRGQGPAPCYESGYRKATTPLPDTKEVVEEEGDGVYSLKDSFKAYIECEALLHDAVQTLQHDLSWENVIVRWGEKKFEFTRDPFCFREMDEVEIFVLGE